MSEAGKPLHIVILAAGEGTRMASDLPKILQSVGGRPMLAHLLKTARELQPAAIHIVVGSQAESVKAVFAGQPDLHWILQRERLGTGHAVEQALPSIPEAARIMVLYGDHPLIPLTDLQALLTAPANLSLLTMLPDSATGYGRVLRDRTGRVEGIVEHKDATPTQLQIREVNTGMLVADRDLLGALLSRITNRNAQGEYYLTDIFNLAYEQNLDIAAVVAGDADDLQGANDRRQLALLERRYQRQMADDLMRRGVTLLDPARLDVRGEVETGRDVVIDINVVLEGRVRLADGVYLGPGVVIRDAEIGPATRVEAYSVIEDARVGQDCTVGPFARLRPQTELADDVRVGNFVEIKKSRLGEGSKASHLSYLGDSEIGSEVNIGAGTITCNYDGANKHKTVIGDGAFIGSDVQLVAPVTVGENATVGAGSTITKDVPASTLAVSRARQSVIRGWQRPQRKQEKN